MNTNSMERESKIYIAGHNGMVGSAIKRFLEKCGYNNIVTKNSKRLDLRNQAAVNNFFETEQPQFVFFAAAKVGGIHANNTFRADFIYENLMMEANVIHAAYVNNVEKMLFLGSSCIYPKMAAQPLKEEYLLSGYLEHTNEPYAIAKIAGIKMCEAYRDQYGCNFISAMPTNLYGPNDNYNLETSHVLPALIHKIYIAKQNNEHSFTVWGTGNPLREFLYVEDLAEACFFLMQHYNDQHFINIGSGEDLSIKDLAHTIAKVLDYKGAIVFDASKPDGTPRKLMDVSKINKLGWKATTNLEKGISLAYNDFLHRIKQNEKLSLD